MQTRFLTGCALAGVALALTLSLTTFAWAVAAHNVHEREQARFQGRVREATTDIVQRMDTYIHTLRGAASYLQAEAGVDRERWGRYIQGLELARHYPGFQGVGFASLVKHDQRTPFVQQARSEGIPDFALRPAGTRAEYVPITYIEPMKGRNRRALGFDMFSEPTRRQAMERARDTGAPAMTSKVILEQETNKAPQGGFLIYLPIYRQGVPVTTVQERRQALIGYVYSPFRAGDLFQNIFHQQPRQLIGFEIYDGRTVTAASLLHDHNPTKATAVSGQLPGGGAPPRFTKRERVELGGHVWTIAFASLPAFEESPSRQLPLIVLLGGLSISGLVTCLVWSQATRRQRAEAEVASRTAELQVANAALVGQSDELQAINKTLEGQGDLLRSQHAFIQGLINNLPAGVAYYNRKLEFELINPLYAKQLGLGDEAVIGRNVADVYGEAAAPLVSLMTRIVETGEPINDQSYPFSYARDGQTHAGYWDVIRSPVFGDDGAVTGVLVLCLDVTESVRLEGQLAKRLEELTAQKALTERIIKHAPVGIAYLDRDLVYRWNNATHCHMLGLPETEIVGKFIEQVIPGVEASAGALHRKVLETGQAHHASGFKTTHRRQGVDVTRYWDASYLPMLGEDGTTQGVLVLAANVTERVERELLQDEQIEHWRQVDHLKGQFLSILSHELRTPLNAVLGFASVLDDEVLGPLTDEQHKYMGKILSGTEVLLALINDLLDMSRIQAGKFALSPAPMRLEEVAAVAIENLSTLADQKGHQLHLECTSGLPALVADEQRTSQVLFNLIGNAIKFTPEGGTITVRAYQRDGFVRCEVEDNGIGIAADDQQRLFMPFMQIDASNTRPYGGTGLGLSICKALVEAHGGHIGVRSTTGQGATFWFELPLQARVALNGEASAQTPSHPGA